MPEKRQIILTDLAFHTRTGQPTASFAKAEEKAVKASKPGRIYGHLPKPDPKDIDRKNHTIKFQINLPPDLMEQMKRGERELVMPKEGLPIYAGKDSEDFLKGMNRKERRRYIHKHPTRTWSPGEKE